MDVRRIGPADAALWRAAVVAILDPADREGRLAAPGEIATAAADERCYLLVAMRGDEPAGLLSAYRFPDLAAGGAHAYLYDVEVRTAHRRRGFGAALLSGLVQHCRAWRKRTTRSKPEPRCPCATFRALPP